MLNDISWSLATTPDIPPQFAEVAVQVAERTVKLSPSSRTCQNTLGVAQYYAGHWTKAVASLQKSMELGSGGDAFDWFFLAMAQWQLGQKDEARNWYDKAVEWAGKNQPNDDELRRFREEAAGLLGIEETPLSKKE